MAKPYYVPPRGNIPPEHYNGMPYPPGWQHYPNGDMRQCQCVNDHRGREGGLAQCTGPRDEASDLYCEGCEQVHGKDYNARLADGGAGWQSD
jgi:hypothetical protein